MPRPKEHMVTLTGDERAELGRVVSSGVHPARLVRRARILLALDETGGPAPFRRVVAEREGVSEATVYNVARRYSEKAGRVGEVVARKRRLTPPVEPKVTGEVEARVVMLACSRPPEGRARWTLRLLERQVLLTEGMPPLDHSTIGRILKRGLSSRTCAPAG